jgi:hypothetical protein
MDYSPATFFGPVLIGGLMAFSVFVILNPAAIVSAKGLSCIDVQDCYQCDDATIIPEFIVPPTISCGDPYS